VKPPKLFEDAGGLLEISAFPCVGLGRTFSLQVGTESPQRPAADPFYNSGRLIRSTSFPAHDSGSGRVAHRSNAVVTVVGYPALIAGHPARWIAVGCDAPLFNLL